MRRESWISLTLLLFEAIVLVLFELFDGSGRRQGVHETNAVAHYISQNLKR